MLHHTSHEDLPLHVQDKANGLCYTRNGDYYFPDLELPPQQPLGRWARLHLRHLQAHHPTHVQRLLLTGTLSEWRAWTGLPFDTSGPVHVPDALAPVHCDAELGIATYVEPNIWVSHSTEG